MVINSDTLEFIQNINMFDGEIGFIKSTSQSILIGNEHGDFINSPIIDGSNLVSQEGTCLRLDSPVIAASFDS